jgi:hypothetical protein
MPITTTPSGGPQGELSTYTPIYSQTLSSTASSITFSNIPQGYTDLQLVCQTLASGSALNLTVNVNGDTSANYSITSLYARSEGAGTAVSSTRAANATYALANYGTATTTNAQSVSHLDFLNYSNNATFKPIIVRAATASGNTTFSGNEIIANQWRSLAAITSITLGGGTFASGSTFTLYGVKAAATQFIPTKAAGGDAVVSDGTYAYHVFRSSGVFSAAQSLTCDYLVVAGGGSGGGGYAGGGGAGGLRSTVGATGGGGTVESALSITSGTSYTIQVGAGGASVTTSVIGNNGTNSVFSTVTATGGGGGGNGNTGGNPSAASGGSGGGGGGANTGTSAGGTGTANQGYAGGTGSSGSAAYGGGGGGGAGGVGANGGSGNSNGANGGAGVSISAFASATGTGLSNFYAGGGGGTVDGGTGTQSNGGAGGGGRGTVGWNGTNPSPGSANTGGGGGAGLIHQSKNGQAGGSGIVIVRYAL